MEVVNFASLPVTALLVLVGAPVLFYRAGYPWTKMLFGTISALVVSLAVWGILSTIQRKAGLDAVPMGWLVPVATIVSAWLLHTRAAVRPPA